MYERPCTQSIGENQNIVCYINVLIPGSVKLFYEIYSCSSPAEDHDTLKSSWKQTGSV